MAQRVKIVDPLDVFASYRARLCNAEFMSRVMCIMKQTCEWCLTVVGSGLLWSRNRSACVCGCVCLGHVKWGWCLGDKTTDVQSENTHTLAVAVTRVQSRQETR